MSALSTLGRAIKPKNPPKISPIGLDLASDALHLVQLQGSAEGRPLIKAQATVAYPQSREALLQSVPETKRLVKQALSEDAFVGRSIVTSLGSEDTRLLSVTYQAVPGESDDAAIGKLMAERIEDDLEQFVIDYLPVRTEARDGDRLALVVMCERNKVVQRLELLRKARLAVKALEIAPIAIRRIVSALIEEGNSQRDVLVINCGEQTTHLIVVSGRRLLFEQSVDFCTGRIKESLMNALDLNEDLAQELIQRGFDVADKADQREDAMALVSDIMRPVFKDLVNEIRRALLFAASETRGTPIQEAFLMGSIVNWPGVTPLLTELTGLTVRTPPPLGAAPGVKFEGWENSTGSLVAAGLALRGFQQHA